MDVAFKLGSLSMLLGAIAYFVLVNVDRHHLGQHDDVGEPTSLEQALYLESQGEI